MIKVVGFDIDDTLISKRDFYLCCFRPIASQIADRTKLSTQEIYLRLMKEYDECNRIDTIGAVLRHYDIHSESYLKKLVYQFREVRAKKAVYPDTVKALKELRSMKLPVVCVTDGKEDAQKKKLIQTGLKSYFDFVIVTDELGKAKKKPNPEAFIQIFSKYRIKPKEFLYIGDNPYRDFIVLKKMGSYTIRVIREGSQFVEIRLPHKYEAHHCVLDLKTIKRYLLEINEE